MSKIKVMILSVLLGVYSLLILISNVSFFSDGPGGVLIGLGILTGAVFVCKGMYSYLKKDIFRAIQGYRFASISYLTATIILAISSGILDDFILNLFIPFLLTAYLAKGLEDPKVVSKIIADIISNLKKYVVIKSTKIILNEITLESILLSMKDVVGKQGKISLAENKLNVAKNDLIGCVVRIEDYDKKKNKVYVTPYIPSTRIAVILSVITVALTIGMMLKVSIMAGIIVAVCSFASRYILPQKFIKEILGRVGPD